MSKTQELRLAGGCVLSIGNFDGVHRGHQEIVAALVEHAERLSVPSVVMTFEPHPAALLHPEKRPPRLTTAMEKCRLLERLGVEVVLEYPTNWELLNLSPEEFFHKIVLNELGAVGLVEGPNFFFGKGRSGNGETLRIFCGESKRFLEIISPTLLNGRIVSSSSIRDALRQGDVRTASDLLGRPYSIAGTVVAGAQRGRTIGFPTANLDQIETMLPAEGVYAAITEFDGRRIETALNIGPNPTFDDGRMKVEAHLLETSADLYGREIRVNLIERIRGLVKFGSVSELQVQIIEDIASIRSVLGNHADPHSR